MRWFFILCACLLSLNAFSKAPPAVFRFHLPSEPSSLDPARLRSSDADYFLTLLYTGLYRLDSQGHLTLDGALRCLRRPLKLTCDLRPDRRWSNGRPVQAQDYVRALQHLLEPGKLSFRAELLRPLKGAAAILRGEKPPTQLGVAARKDFQIEFQFEREDYDFEYKLSSVALAPIPPSEIPNLEKATNLIGNGPYLITERKPGARLRLEENPHFPKLKEGERPPVEILFIGDDEAALTLYEKKELTFLRRVASSHIPTFRERKDFVQIPVSRFDYIGFHPALQQQPELRAALAQSLDFDELQRLLVSPGKPGCPSFPEAYLDRPACIKMDLGLARKALAKVPKDTLARPLRVEFSALGGDDHRRVFTWAQAQWKKNLNLDVEIQAQEQGVFLSRLKAGIPPLFRKGVSLERPTCLAALETFGPESPENYIGFKDAFYQNLLQKLSAQQTSGARAKQLCRQGVERLLEEFRIIPLGHFQFTMLADPRFQGWEVNEMNQLNLSNLHFVGP